MTLFKISHQRKTLGDSIYAHLRNEIISLRLKPGEMIYENEVASDFGVSRTPVREAFRLLVNEEFIEILPQKGARISYISTKKVKEAWFVRESLEISAFKKVAIDWNNEEDRFQKMYKSIVENLEEQRQASRKQDYVEFFRLDEVYHKIVMDEVDNATLLSFINQLRGHVNRLRYLEFYDRKDTNRITDDHQAIFDALINKDPAKVEDLLTKHLRQSPNYLQKVIDKYPDYFQLD
ncbi:GntR family transcriptional regulator [Priestia endophytica]|uniref:GntR family transcriptional regulator n=1 Tax=Priestia endophytica TaxID=135735 RepID=UPI00227E407F|nr:GntR family transcriptional regulator [Priestia endophytica]MCY8234555.1 GntR family transcriptional regulator [Priestia endophytica]